MENFTYSLDVNFKNAKAKKILTARFKVVY